MGGGLISVDIATALWSQRNSTATKRFVGTKVLHTQHASSLINMTVCMYAYIYICVCFCVCILHVINGLFLCTVYDAMSCMIQFLAIVF